jgi:hypothetical protein
MEEFLMIVVGLYMALLVSTTKHYVPTLNTLELLLQGHPGEFYDEPTGDQPESDRAAMVAAARRWLSNPSLRQEEYERIQRVWIDGEYRPALNVSRARRDELRALIVPRRAREAVSA